MKDEEIGKFWAEYEARVGEKVIAKALAQYESGAEGIPPNIWGLLVATESALRFDHSAQDTWISQLFGSKGKGAESYSFVVPKDEIVSIKACVENNLLRRIFLPIRDGILVETNPKNGSAGALRFIMDRQSVGNFLEACSAGFVLDRG